MKSEEKKNIDKEYEEIIKEKLDSIIEKTHIENSALKKILNSLKEFNKVENEDKKSNNKKNKKR